MMDGLSNYPLINLFTDHRSLLTGEKNGSKHFR